MARASTTTWLPLDQWAKILGINPLHFNGVFTATQPNNHQCNSLWFQHAWQDDNQVSREDVAIAIKDAEEQIATRAGYNLLPDWIHNERINTTPHFQRYKASPPWNARGRPKTIQMRRGYLLTGGFKAKSAINNQAAIIRSDIDMDGYDEHCTVIITTSVSNLNHIRAFYPGEMAGEDDWEIRPIKVTRLNPTQIKIEFKIWQIPKYYLWEALNAEGIDGDDPDNFLTFIAVWKVSTDNSTEALMLWNAPNLATCGCGLTTCKVCAYQQQCACLQINDQRLGHFQYSPDSGTWATFRDPNQILVNYFSGWQDQTRRRPCIELDPYWARAICYYSLALISREICACCNNENFIRKWQDDFAAVPDEGTSFQSTPLMLNNPFGTTRGGLYAWQRVNQEGRRVAK